MSRHMFICPAVVAAIVLGCGSGAHAQLTEPETYEAETDDGGLKLNFTVNAGFVHQFEADLDGTGEYSVDRFGASIGIETPLTDDLSLRIGAGYNFDGYDFSGGLSSFGGMTPWEDIHTINLGATLTYRIDQQWSIFGGPIVRFSREDGADWDDALTAGGTVGVMYAVSENFVIGGGFGIVSELEDDVEFYPIIIVNYFVNEQLSVRSGRVGIGIGGPGVELVYAPAEQWEFGFGLGYLSKRFRLDDSGVAPGGVGDEESLLLMLRATWHASENVSISALGGITAATELELENAAGVEIGDDEPDTAFFAGVRATVRF